MDNSECLRTETLENVREKDRIYKSISHKIDVENQDRCLALVHDIFRVIITSSHHPYPSTAVVESRNEV